MESYLASEPGFLGVFPRDLVPKSIPPGTCLIANLQSSNESGSHWVSLARERSQNGKGIYFDPFGLAPQPEWIDLLGKNYLHNTVDYQPSASQLCGYYCYYFCKHFLEGWSYYDILHKQLIPAPKQMNDTIVRNYILGGRIYISHPGSLKFFGYKADNSRESRIISLNQAIKTFGLTKVYQKIQALKNLAASDLKLSEIYSEDLDYLKWLKSQRNSLILKNSGGSTN